MLGRPPLKSASREEQLRAIEENGVMGALNWGDVFFDIEANRMAAKLYGEAVARIVKDPETAAALVPDASVRAASARSSTRATTRRSTATTSRWSTCASRRSVRSRRPASAPSSDSTNST